MDFVVAGAMIRGSALEAARAGYRVTDAKTHIVSYEAIVSQKDLAPGARKIFKDMELHNPDSTW